MYISSHLLNCKLRDMESILMITPSDILFRAERVAEVYAKQLVHICESADFCRALHCAKYKSGGFCFGTEELIYQCKQIVHPSFVPRHEHMLACRIKTTGIIDIEYKLSGCRFRVFDGKWFIITNTYC